MKKGIWIMLFAVLAVVVAAIWLGIELMAKKELWQQDSTSLSTFRQTETEGIENEPVVEDYDDSQKEQEEIRKLQQELEGIGEADESVVIDELDQL